MAGYRNELLDEWEGGIVLLGRAFAPLLSEEQAENMEVDPTYGMILIPQSVRENYRFVGYDEVGITIRKLAEEGEEEPLVFVPWGAVITLEREFSSEDGAR